jgi:SAM-dependent methyltransferase
MILAMGIDRTGEWQEEPLTAEQCARWTTVLDYLIAAMPRDDGLVVVAGTDNTAGTLADRLAVHLRERGRTGVEVVADGARTSDHDLPGAWHLTAWVRTPAAEGGNRGDDADAIVDLHEPAWPVLRHIDPWLVPHYYWYRTESRAFCDAQLILADARHLPLADASVDAVFAAGLVPHLPDHEAGLAELARVTRTGGSLVIFHPCATPPAAPAGGSSATTIHRTASTPLPSADSGPFTPPGRAGNAMGASRRDRPDHAASAPCGGNRRDGRHRIRQPARSGGSRRPGRAPARLDDGRTAAILTIP